MPLPRRLLLLLLRLLCRQPVLAAAVAVQLLAVELLAVAVAARAAVLAVALALAPFRSRHQVAMRLTVVVTHLHI